MKLIRYFCVGGAAAVVDITLFTALAQFAGFPWFPVAVFSFVVATLVNYFLSINYVFDSSVRFRKRHEVVLVFFASGIGLVANQVILWILIEVQGMHLVAAKIIATGGVFFWNYAARRLFIFRKL
ncbi:MAG: GtrA family protein [Chloroflexi bacterium]|nr:GtrA family protein [Chloroflexota bacterium]